MLNKDKNVDHLLDRAASQIKSARPDPEVAEDAARRVWDRLEKSAAQAPPLEIGEIRGCEDYQALLPAFLAGTLPEARRMLVEDHTRSCVPCRKALKSLRDGRPLSAPAPFRRAANQNRTLRRFLAAAAILAGIGFASLLAMQFLPFSHGPSATAMTAEENSLFRVSRTAYLPIEEGEVIEEGERVRTGRTSGAVLRLGDGSLIELKERTELSIDEGRRGTTLQLERGSVIVEAAEQRERHLYVATDDCLVSVTGTIFSVNHGTKGSRVSVIEGEVRVDHSGEETVLEPGQQVVTHQSLIGVPVAEEIAWSRNVDGYIDILQELHALRRDLDQFVPRPGLRYSSRLVDLLPEETIFFGAVPNLSETLAESFRVIRDRVEASPALSQWWEEQGGTGEFAEEAEEIIAKISHFGETLGEELVVAGEIGGDGDIAGPLVLAELDDGAALRAFVEEEMSEHGDGEHVVFLDDPFSAAPGGDDALYIWLGDDLAVASPRPEQIRAVAQIVLRGSPNTFVGSEFHASIAALYAEGAGILAGADLGRVIDHSQAQSEGSFDAPLEAMGFENVEHLLVEQKRHATGSEQRAVVTFADARHGMASWLAEPAPMGSLDFLSPETKFFTSFVFKDPVALTDDLENILGSAGSDGPAALFQLEQEFGVDLREDLAATLGGELTLAVDGPLLPAPAFKLVLEVYDPARFQWTLEQAIAEVNTELVAEGKDPLELELTDVGGRTFYALPSALGDFHYTFADGYLVAAPSRALVEQALRYRDSGYGIVQSPRFVSALPTDGRDNFSALLYYDVGEFLQPLAERLAEGQELTDAQRQALEELRGDSSPMLAYAYGEEDRLIFAASHTTDFLSSGLLSLVGLSDPTGLGQLLGSLSGSP